MAFRAHPGDCGGLLDSTAAAAPSHPDAFQYEISVPESGRSVVVGEHELPSELDPLRQRLSQGGQAEPPSRRG